MSTPVFVIAQQRSGTNLLRRSLATTGCFWDSDEIFDPKLDVFWPHCLEQIRQQPKLSLPTSENRIELFERFLEAHLDNPKPFTLIDVKYNSTHLLDGLWHSPVTSPEFVEWLIRKKHPVIHLVRNNCLENYVSMVAGHYTGKWVVGKSSNETDPIRLRLDPRETVFQIQRRKREMRRFRDILSRTNHMELEYELLIDEQGEFSNTVAHQIFGFVGLDKSAVSIQVPTRKTGRPVQETVENFQSEIVPALIENRLTKYISSQTKSNENGQESLPTDADSPYRSEITVRSRPHLFYVPRIPRNKPHSQPVFVIAMQRSGANLFRKSLATSDYFHDLNEIFDPYRQLYWPYREQLLSTRPELAVPTARNQLELFESFLDQALDSKKPFTFIDVKYNSTQHLNDVWYHPGARPLLIDWLIEQKCPVIHLVRENIFENYVSNVVAHQTRVGLVEKSGPVTARSVRLKVSDTLRSIQRFKTQIDVFRKWLEPTNHIELTYESLIDQQGGLSSDTIRETCNLVGIENEFEISIPTRKTGRSLSEMVENYESEIAPALIAGGYHDWLNQKAA